MASQSAKDTHLKWNTAKSLVQTSIKVATHSEVDTNNRSGSWNLPKSFVTKSCFRVRTKRYSVYIALNYLARWFKKP